MTKFVTKFITSLFIYISTTVVPTGRFAIMGMRRQRKVEETYVTYEAQIIIRRDSAQELMTDYAAISAFIEQRNAARSGSSRGSADAVSAAERIVRGNA